MERYKTTVQSAWDEHWEGGVQGCADGVSGGGDECCREQVLRGDDRPAAVTSTGAQTGSQAAEAELEVDQVDVGEVGDVWEVDLG